MEYLTKNIRVVNLGQPKLNSMKTISIDIYQQIIWIVLEAFEQERVPFNFIPSLYSTEDEKKKAFREDHYDKARIILSWYHNQFCEKKIIPQKSLWGFSKKLQDYLPETIETRWKSIEQKENFDLLKKNKFIFPENSFSNITKFPGLTKEMISEEEKFREKRNKKNPIIGIPTGIFMNSEDRDSDDIYKRYS